MVLKELFLTVIIFTFFSGCALASSETVTGPVTFLWPEQRTWYAAWQTNSPCGTNDGLVENRTNFPLGRHFPDVKYLTFVMKQLILGY
jgi:hypothetical protein